MMRKDEKYWIKVTPITQKSNPSSLHLSMDNKEHYWNIYDDKGRDKHKVYFKGKKIMPSFCLKLKNKSYRFDFNDKGIKVQDMGEIKGLTLYIKNKCNIESSIANCWAIDIYHTCSPEEHPFDLM